MQIQHLRKQGKLYRFIARTLGCHQQTAKKWANKTFGNIQDKKRSGRSTKLNQKQKQRIIQNIFNNGVSLRKLGWKHKLSHQTIKNIIKNHCPTDPIKAYKRPVIPKLTDPQKN